MEDDPITKSLFLPTPSARRATVLADQPFPLHTDFYPRPPRGGRPHGALGVAVAAEFLPTPSARRATLLTYSLRGGWNYFYPRPPRGGRPRREVMP